MIDYYTGLLADTDRVKAFQEALTTAVRPDDVVVEIGSGVGTFAIFAARAGARRVFGIESSPVVEFARQIARKNEVDIDFIGGDALEVELPEQASLLVFEDFSNGLLDGATRALLEHALPRWMGKDFRVLPERASLHVAPIQSEISRSNAFPMEGMEVKPYGIDFGPIKQAVENTVHDLRSPSDIVLLGEAQEVMNHALNELLPTTWKGAGQVVLDQAGKLDGLCMWLDFHLDATRTYSNRPTGQGVYGQVFFPVPERWAVGQGQRLNFEVRYQAIASGGMWSWSFELLGAEGVVDKQFAGNTFAASVLTADNLRQFDADRVVELSSSAQAEAFVLSLVDGKRTLLEISEEIRSHFGNIDAAEALEIARRYLAAHTST